MSSSQHQIAGGTGSDTWTRELACDVFPGLATPFAWSVLRAPAETALRHALMELGAPGPAAAPLWRRADDGRVYVSAPALTEAGRALYGAAWLGVARPEPSAGMLARLQAGGVIRRAQARIDQARAEVGLLHARLSSWLAWMGHLHLSWSQADLLQVMEELEPRAREVLQAYFILAAGLAAARSQVDDQLAEWLPGTPLSVKLGLFIGLEELPTVHAARRLAAVAAVALDDPTRRTVLARYGHRGPGEIRPDARRWADDPALLAHLAGQVTRHTADAAERQRVEAEAWIAGRLDEGRRRQLSAALTRARDLCLAADLAWDALTMVMASAQRWLRAVSGEVLEAGLISRQEDILYLELEELKQVATGEWHRSRSAAVQTEVARRRVQRPVEPLRASSPVPVSPGQAYGPAHIAASTTFPAPGAIWLAEGADPGCAPLWLGAAAVVTAEADAWGIGMIAARALGVPAVGGGVDALTQAQPGQMISIDGNAGRVALD